MGSIQSNNKYVMNVIVVHILSPPFHNSKGLDPALPLYMFISPSTRLSADAANFVDVIHTDGGVLGYPWPLGHADFYPNHGIFQPGCAKQELSKNRWYSIVGKKELELLPLVIRFRFNFSFLCCCYAL